MRTRVEQVRCALPSENLGMFRGRLAILRFASREDQQPTPPPPRRVKAICDSTDSSHTYSLSANIIRTCCETRGSFGEIRIRD